MNGLSITWLLLLSFYVHIFKVEADSKILRREERQVCDASLLDEPVEIANRCAVEQNTEKSITLGANHLDCRNLASYCDPRPEIGLVRMAGLEN
jgi:hypothetical protein